MKKQTLSILTIALALTVNLQAAVTAYFTFEGGTDGSGGLGAASSPVVSDIGGLSGTINYGTPDYVAVTLPNHSDVGLDIYASRVEFNTNVTPFQWSENENKTMEFFITRNGENTDGSSSEIILGKDYSGSGWVVYYDAGNDTINFNIKGNTITSTSTIADGTVNHVAITHAANSGEYNLYLNYELEDTLSGYTGGSVSSGNFVFGGYGWQNPRVINGTLDQLRVSNTVLTPASFIPIPEPATLTLVLLSGLTVTLRRRTARK